MYEIAADHTKLDLNKLSEHIDKKEKTMKTNLNALYNRFREKKIELINILCIFIIIMYS